MGLSRSSVSPTFTSPVTAFSSPSHTPCLSVIPPIRKQGGHLKLWLGCRWLQNLCTAFFFVHARMLGITQEPELQQ